MATNSQMYPDQDMSQRVQELEKLVSQQAEQIQTLSENLSHSISALSTAADSQLVKELWVSTDGTGIVVRTADDVMRRAECRVVS